MILSEFTLLVCPDTSLVHGLGTLKSPPGFPAKPFPELPPELLDELEPLMFPELLEVPIPAEPELELVASPPIPPEAPALPAPPVPLLSLGPHAAADVASQPTRMTDDPKAQRTGFVVSMSCFTLDAQAMEAAFSRIPSLRVMDDV
ncbi:MAG TPA: hypothetical protein PKA58_09595 [Polyangium sp.]|nr:hypothetical protein [Polyangium sp.]